MPSEPQSGAKTRLVTEWPVPPAAAPNEIDEIADGHQPERVQQGAIALMVVTNTTLPPAATNEIGDGDISGGERVTKELGTNLGVPVAANIAALAELQRQRRFSIVSQGRSNRACESFIARYMGFSVDLPPAERLAIFKRAAALRRAVEKGGEGPRGVDYHQENAFAACTPIILNSAVARRAWDAHRSQTEKAMRKLARSLHVWPWVESVVGFGDLGLAIIIGETGDLSNYATKERVWKRLGLAVIDGERQQRKTNVAAASAHGYNPKRRAEVWTVADSLFRQQWRGVRDDAPAGPTGPYGVVYGRRKAHTASREDWTLKRRDNDARRIMSKFLIENLWRVWRGLPLLELDPKT